MFLNYWNLEKHAFNNVPDPSMYFSMHQSVETAVGEVLFAIEEGDECLAVITGGVGVGKTTTFRIVLDTLETEKYTIAFITNPDLSFVQLMREIIGQLEGEECTERRKERLLEMFNKILFKTNDEGKRVLIFIDEGNVIKPANLDSLRLLTNMQDDEQNLFTIIMAGQPELAKRLEDPRRENLFQRIGIYCKLNGLECRDTMKDYIEHRLERAGHNGPPIFTEDAYNALWEFSNGIPRLVNKLCKLSLKAGETNQCDNIGNDIVEAVGSRFARPKKRTKKTKEKVKEPMPAHTPNTLTAPQVKQAPIPIPVPVPIRAQIPVPEFELESEPINLDIEDIDDTDDTKILMSEPSVEHLVSDQLSTEPREETMVIFEDTEPMVRNVVLKTEDLDININEKSLSQSSTHHDLTPVVPLDNTVSITLKHHNNRIDSMVNNKELMRKASQMAIERLKVNPNKSKDPYQAWLTTRDEIMEEMVSADSKQRVEGRAL